MIVENNNGPIQQQESGIAADNTKLAEPPMIVENNNGPIQQQESGIAADNTKLAEPPRIAGEKPTSNSRAPIYFEE
jgi:hypothetical protein